MGIFKLELALAISSCVEQFDEYTTFDDAVRAFVSAFKEREKNQLAANASRKAFVFVGITSVEYGPSKSIKTKRKINSDEEPKKRARVARTPGRVSNGSVLVGRIILSLKATFDSDNCAPNEWFGLSSSIGKMVFERLDEKPLAMVSAMREKVNSLETKDEVINCYASTEPSLVKAIKSLMASESIRTAIAQKRRDMVEKKKNLSASKEAAPKEEPPRKKATKAKKEAPKPTPKPASPIVPSPPSPARSNSSSEESDSGSDSDSDPESESESDVDTRKKRESKHPTKKSR